MKKISILSLAIVAMMFSLSSCVGRDGRDGIDGRDGQDANVYSMSINVTQNDWDFLTSGSWRLVLTSNSITQSIVDHGVVLVYMEDPDPSYYSWKLIPLTYYYTDESTTGETLYLSASIEMSYYLNGLDIYWTESDFFGGNNPGSRTFRVVLIEGTAIAKGAPVDFSDYEEVVKAYNLNFKDIVKVN